MRGKIIHTDRARQINDFSGLRIGNITPTDIDGVIEYKNSKYIFFEVKYLSKELPYGQRLALERLVDDTSATGKISIAIVCEHNVHDTNEEVDVANCIVRETYGYWTKDWYKPASNITLSMLVDMFISV